MKFLPILIFIVIVINVLRRLAEYNRNRPQSGDEGWQEWPGDQPVPPAGPAATPARPATAPRPTPSDRVREILEQLAQGDRPVPPPVARPVVPPPVPRPVSVPPPVASPVRPAVPPARRYLSAEAVEAAREVEREVATDVPHLPAPLAGEAIVRESLGKALPAMPALAHGMRARHRRPYVVQVRGRHHLRRAIVLAEVLGPPRAYDV